MHPGGINHHTISMNHSVRVLHHVDYNYKGSSRTAPLSSPLAFIGTTLALLPISSSICYNLPSIVASPHLLSFPLHISFLISLSVGVAIPIPLGQATNLYDVSI